MGEWPPEAALLARAFLFICQIEQKISQRLPSRKLRGNVGLKSVSGHLNAQWFALTLYLPTPAFRALAAPKSNDVKIVGTNGHMHSVATHERL
jgi:hypothetical protein